MIRKAPTLTFFFLSFFFLSLALPIQRTLAQDGISVANDDFFNIREDSSLSVPTPGLFFNDDQTDDSLLVVLVSPPGNGTVTVNQDGSFDYTPNKSRRTSQQDVHGTQPLCQTVRLM